MLLLCVCRALWGTVDTSRVTTVEEGALRVWDVAGSSAQQVEQHTCTVGLCLTVAAMLSTHAVALNGSAGSFVEVCVAHLVGFCTPECVATDPKSAAAGNVPGCSDKYGTTAVLLSFK